MPVTAIAADPRDKYSADLFNGLGSFWTRMYTDRDFINLKCKGDSLLAAQTYLNLLEAASCLSMDAIPVFHRERWFPMVIRKSERNLGDSVRLYMGITPDAVIGPQPSDTAYTSGQEFYIGGPALKHGFVVYPAHSESFHSGMLSICSSIIAPTTTYLLNVDYYVDRSGIVFKAELDPFAEDSAFIKRTIKNASGVEDVEIVLWGTDVYVDRNYVPDHFGYMQTLSVPEDPKYQGQAVGAILGLRGGGSNMVNLMTSLGRLFETPVVQYDGEVVEHIYVNSDNSAFVLTQRSAYRCRPEETLLPEIVKGASLNRGDLLTTTVKFYRKLNPDKFQVLNGHSLEDFIADVPRLSLHKGVMYGKGLASGISVTWADVPITYHGDDINGNPKLRFDVGGSEDNQNQYWDMVWAKAVAGDINLSTILSDYLTSQPPYAVEGMTVGTINPMRFFMKNCLNSNTSVMIVDFDSLPEYIKPLDMMYELNRSIPAHTVILMMSKKLVVETSYDMVTMTDAVASNYGRKVSEAAGEGTSLAYNDFGIRYKWVTRGAL